MKKNILVLNYEFPPLGGGGSPVCYEISKRYSQAGHHVDVVTMGFKGLAKYEEIDGIHLYRVHGLRSKKQVCHPWEQLIYLFFGYFKVKKLFKQRKYDICHTHFIIPTGILARKVKHTYGLNYILTAHGSDVLGHNPRFDKIYPYLKSIWKKVLDDAKTVVSPSLYLKEKIDCIYGENPKVTVIPNGIAAEKFIPHTKEKYILTVSRLVHAKGIQDLLEAVKGIELGDWKIKVVGEGPMLGELKNLVKKYKLGGNVQFLGWVDNNSDEMKALYGRASIFCQPSHFENMSIVLIEAMQAGCAIVANDVGGNKEVVGSVGVYKAHSKVSLQERLKDLMSDNTLRDSISKENIGQSKQFEWDNILPSYIKQL